MDGIIEKNYKKIIVIIFALGILFRLLYIVESPIRKNQYDCKIWSLYTLDDYEQVYEQNEENIGSGGHIYYIMMLYNTMRLPETIGGQYYHPPLHHFISAMWLKIIDIFPLNAMNKLESLQILSFIYSLLTMLFCYKIIEKTKIKEKGKILAYILINFSPFFIYMSGFVNNDPLVTLFIVANLYYLIEWNEKQSIKNTLLVAITFGFGMMTKTSIVVNAVPIVYFVLKNVWNQIKEKKKIKKLIIEILIFIIIAGGMGLWYQIRNIIKFEDWKFMSIQKPYEHFYCGDASFLERWGFVSKDMLNNEITTDCSNIFAYVINSSLYCLYKSDTFWGYAIKAITVIFSIYAFISVIKRTILFFLKKEKEENEAIILIAFWSWVLGFISFNISLPYSCTMHSRYLGILFIISSIVLGMEISEKKNKIFIGIVYAFAILLSVLSVPIVLR